MSLFGKITLWLLLTGVVILVIDELIGRFIDWRERRDAHIKAALLNRYSMGCFKGTRDWRHL